MILKLVQELAQVLRPKQKTIQVANIDGALTAMLPDGTSFPLQLANRGMRTAMSGTVLTATYTATLLDKQLIGNTAAGGFTINLPPIATTPDGTELSVINIGASNTLTVDGNASETINGATTHTLATQYAKATYKKYSAGWLIVG